MSRRDDDDARLGQCVDTRGDVHLQTEDVLVLLDGFTGVQADAES